MNVISEDRGLTLADRVCEHLFLICIKSIKRNVVSRWVGLIGAEMPEPINFPVYLPLLLLPIRQELVHKACKDETRAAVYMSTSSESSFNSLFDEAEEAPIASRSIPPIPGLSVFPGLLPPEAAGAPHPNLDIVGC
jgi:hypothetical protein